MSRTCVSRLSFSGQWLAAIFWIGLASTALAQTSTTKQPVRGIVVDEQGKPVAGAEATISWNLAANKPAITGADGKFEIANQFSPNGQMIVVRTPDGLTQGVYFDLPYEEEKVEAALDVRIQLTPAESIAVRVIDKKGMPIPGANAGASIRYGGFREIQVWGQTNAKGEANWKIVVEIGLGPRLRHLCREK
jgi:hypothetical protein